MTTLPRQSLVTPSGDASALSIHAAIVPDT